MGIQFEPNKPQPAVQNNNQSYLKESEENLLFENKSTKNDVFWDKFRDAVMPEEQNKTPAENNNAKTKSEFWEKFKEAVTPKDEQI